MNLEPPKRCLAAIVTRNPVPKKWLWSYYKRDILEISLQTAFWLMHVLYCQRHCYQVNFDLGVLVDFHQVKILPWNMELLPVSKDLIKISMIFLTTKIVNLNNFKINSQCLFTFFINYSFQFNVNFFSCKKTQNIYSPSLFKGGF